MDKNLTRLARVVPLPPSFSLPLLTPLPPTHNDIEPSLPKMKDHVVAIDLGTSCTAYSWKSAMDRAPAVGVPDMKPSEDIVGKSPTVLLIEGRTAPAPSKIFTPTTIEAFGKMARNRYADADISPTAQLFKRFKMQLHSPTQQSYDDLTSAVTRSASKQAEMKLLDIFVMALEYIKNAALERITVTQAVKAEDVTWVLTVPVCCSEPAKKFMRQAAIQAGFIKGGGDDKAVVLCMEPVAACLALEGRLSMKRHDKYLVIDCGGGTVDISAFEVASDNPVNLNQVGKASGGRWGSTNVDDQFEGYLKDFVLSVAHDAGEQGLESFFSSGSMYRILQAWERVKVNLESVDEECRVDLVELSYPPLEVEMKDMDNGRRLMNRGAEDLVGGHGTWELVLRPALLRKFFEPHCHKIAQAVSEQLDMPHLQGLTSVVMVGGFSGSVHVQEAVNVCIREKYRDNSVNMCVAPSPDLAIVQGAAHFVHLQRGPETPIYTSIIAPISYGILVKQGKDEVIFDPFFLEGEAYKTDDVVQKHYNVKSGEPFAMHIASCTSASVHAGRNTLEDIGSRNIQTQRFMVVSPVVKRSCCSKLFDCFLARTPRTERKKDQIFVEFTLRGIEIHVKVKNGNRQLVTHAKIGGQPLILL